jgi:hypothetical protein
MAYFVLPDSELARFEHIRQWLRGDVAWLPLLYRGFVPGPGLRQVGLNVEIRADPNDQATPLARVFFAFSTSLHILHIPDASWTLPEELTLPDLGRSPYPPHDVKWGPERIVSDAELEPHDESIDVTIPALANVPPTPDAEIRRAAHARWEGRGGGDGHALDDWLAAEEDLLLEQLRQFSAPVPESAPG